MALGREIVTGVKHLHQAIKCIEENSNNELLGSLSLGYLTTEVERKAFFEWLHLTQNNYSVGYIDYIFKAYLCNYPNKISDLAISGDDITQSLSIRAGKCVGYILNELLKHVAINPSQNHRQMLLHLSHTYYEKFKVS